MQTLKIKHYQGRLATLVANYQHRTTIKEINAYNKENTRRTNFNNIITK